MVPQTKTSFIQGPRQGSVLWWSTMGQRQFGTSLFIWEQYCFCTCKFEVTQLSVAKYPILKIVCKGIKIPALSYSGSEVMLLCQSQFEKYLKSIISPSGTNKTETHSLFKLTAANNGQLSISMYVKLHMYFWDLMCQRWDFISPKVTTASWTISTKPSC